MNGKLSTMAATLGIGLALASIPASATVSNWTWSMADGSAPMVNTSSPGGGPGVAVTGYSAANNASALVSTDLNGGVPNINKFSGGYGICSTGENCNNQPQHAMDNNGYKESLLLDFGSSKVNLTQMVFGWTGSSHGWDSDVSVLAYTGTAPVSSSTTYSTLGSGWQLIGNYANTKDNVSVNVTNNVFASYWMIAAYNSVFSTYGNLDTTACARNSLGSLCSNSNDYVKLYSVAGKTDSGDSGKVSEPSALLLFGGALLGVVGLRRRHKMAAVVAA